MLDGKSTISIIDQEIEAIAKRPFMMGGSLQTAECIIWTLLGLRKDILREQYLPIVRWMELVKERWEDNKKPGNVGYCLYVLHKDKDLWTKDALEIISVITKEMKESK